MLCLKSGANLRQFYELAKFMHCKSAIFALIYLMLWRNNNNNMHCTL